MRYEKIIFIGVFALLCSGVLDPIISGIATNVFNEIANIASLPFSLLGV